MRYVFSCEDTRLNVYTDIALDAIDLEVEAPSVEYACSVFTDRIIAAIDEYRSCDDLYNDPSNYCYNMNVYTSIVDALDRKVRPWICDVHQMHTITVHDNEICIHLFNK